ncbi:MAG: hypothetical protein ABIJ65_01995 [Chloroflexota bacterium]
MDIAQFVTYTLAGVAKFFGMFVFSLGLCWFMLDAYKKSEKNWQIQLTFVAGFFAFLIATAIYTDVSLAGFGFGFGLAIFLWGMPKKPKTED